MDAVGISPGVIHGAKKKLMETIVAIVLISQLT